MFAAIKRVFSVSELRTKIIFTLLLLAACRIGVFIPVPGIDGELALRYFRHAIGGGQNLFQMVDIFSGGAFAQMTVVALGIMPYISASIIMQLFMFVFPQLQREIRENPTLGKRKLIKWTRIATLLLAMLQSGLFARYAFQINMNYPGIVVGALSGVQAFGVPWLFYLVVMCTMTTGTLFLMWVGELITEKGIGNGISLIITVGIVSSLPRAVGLIFKQLNLDSQEPGVMSFFAVAGLMMLFVAVIVGTILVIQGQRNVPLQYARRVVGRKEMQGSASFLPLKINYAGVIPVIFASSLLMFPATLGQFIGSHTWIGALSAYLYPGRPLYLFFYIMLIIFFTYFWTATQFHPDQIASDMKRGGAFIPGIRQGKPTQEFLEATMNRITFIGALCLAIIAVLPTIVGNLLGIDRTISYFFGGTSLLILVGVVLDTMKQIESHLLAKRYDGLMKKGRIRSKR